MNHLIKEDIDSLQTLAEMISELMGSPVTIEDDAHRLLAYSMHDPNTDPARIATIIGRRVPEHVQRALYESGAMQQLLDSEEPQYIRELSEVGLRSRMAISVRHYDQVIGYIWLLENDGSYSAEQLQQLKHGAQIAASRMIQQQQHQQKMEWFRRALQGRFSSEKEATKQAQEIGMTMPDLGYVWVMEQQHGQPDINAWYDKVVQASAEYAVTIYLQLTEPDRLILLCGMNRLLQCESSTVLSTRIGMIVNRMRELLPAEDIHYAVGAPFGSILHIQRSYQQAKELIDLHEHLSETRSIYYYPDAGFYRYLNAMNREAEQFPVSGGSIDRLTAYDKEHNSNLLQTLAIFLDQDSDAKQAALQLHVHTNTLNYRLRRISEVGKIDLTSMAEKVTLYLELKLLWFGEER